MLIGYAREICAVWVRSNRHELQFDERKDVARAWLWSPARGTMSVERAVEQREWVERLLSRLSAHERIVVDFRTRWGMSTRFIAELLGVTESTVRVQFSHGIKKLRAIITDDPFPRRNESDDE